MKLSTDQLERLAERVFKVLKASGHLEFDVIADERIEDRSLDTIMTVLEDDTRMEDRLSREAERLVQQQSHIAKASGKSVEELVDEVKSRLAKSKRVILGDGPERADSLAEKVAKAVWKIEGVDFFSDDQKVQNCIARAIYRFRVEDDRIVESVEKVVSLKSSEEPYTLAWCIAYDKYYQELKSRLTAMNSKSNLAKQPAEM
jgi:hypothetical protein